MTLSNGQRVRSTADDDTCGLFGSATGLIQNGLAYWVKLDGEAEEIAFDCFEVELA